MEKETKKLQGHYIVCGAGRVGRRVIREFQLTSVPFVVIEKDAALAERLSNEGSLTIVGDAADEEVLQKAGIDKARGLIAAISTDADNVYVTLTAKGLRADIPIVTRAQEQSAQKKLLKAGATKVVMPYESAGKILAHSILKPNVADFIESVTGGDIAKLNLQLEEVAIDPHSRIARFLQTRRYTGNNPSASAPDTLLLCTLCCQATERFVRGDRKRSARQKIPFLASPWTSSNHSQAPGCCSRKLPTIL